jgi:hypothetical protein
MNLHEFFTHPDVQLPQRWDTHEDFEAFVGQRLDRFMSLLEQLDRNAIAEEAQRRKPAIQGLP